MTKCFLKLCKSSDRKHCAGVTFHKIPRQMSAKWLRAIKRPLNVLINNQRVCSLHFKESDFETFGERKRIKPGVIPSVNLNGESNLLLPKVKRKGRLPNKTEKKVAPAEPEESPIFKENVLEAMSSEVQEHDYVKKLDKDPLLLPNSCEIKSENDYEVFAKPFNTVDVANIKKEVTEETIDTNRTDFFDVKIKIEPEHNIKQEPSDTVSMAPVLKRKRKVSSVLQSYNLLLLHYQNQLFAEKKKVLFYRQKIKALRRTSNRRKQQVQQLRQEIRELLEKNLSTNERNQIK